MGGSTGDMLAAARRDPNFRGIDPDALGQLVKQTTDAGNAIRSWLSAHRPPPGVPATGYTQAAQAGQWVTTQLGMLTRRRNYALTHPDTGGGVTVPPAGGKLGRTGSGGSGGSGGGAGTGLGKAAGTPSKPRVTPHGAGADLGHYPTHHAAVKAAAADALTIGKAGENHTPIPAGVWQRLKANAHDPDYTQALYERLGPAGTAGLIAAAGHDKARLQQISTSLAMADHQLGLDRKWLNRLLAEADRLHDRAAAVQVLTGAHFTPRTAAALEQVLKAGHVTGAAFSPATAHVTAPAPAHVTAHVTEPPAAPRPEGRAAVPAPQSPPVMSAAGLGPHLVSNRLDGGCATPRSSR
ncbi:hypothetical protein ACRYCC_29000 [Actinomadura scrupuli]|uniref:hypothetical protein n=1 Tax=Actinomadura scrupuli TaxID=559629 RepID=UPI003D96AE85